MSQETTNFDVIIAGAGMAGLSVAWHLLVDHNFNGSVAIVEARNRVGGRILSAEFAGQRVEMGANWIHGIVGNPVYSLAEKLAQFDPMTIGTTSDCYNDPTICARCTPDGQQLPLTMVRSTYETYFRMIKQCECWSAQKAHGHDNGKPITDQDSVGGHLSKQIDEYIDGRPEAERPVLRALFDQMLQRECCINGCESMDQLSLSAFGAYDELPGGNLVLPGGYFQLIERMLIEIKRKSANVTKFKVFLEHELKQVRWPGVCGQKANGQTNCKPFPVELQFTNGKVLFCKHLVNCLPIGVLKHKLIHAPTSDGPAAFYEPPLPDYKLKAIDKIGINAVEKMLIEYEQSLCPLHWDPMVDELLSINPCQDQMQEYQVQRDWTRKIYSFARLNNRLLLAWVYGREARHVQHLYQTNVDELKHQITCHLRALTGKRDFPSPRRVVVTNWASDPYTLGSYSFVAVGGSPDNFDQLAEPIYADPAHQKPVLLFAGESCHPSFFSTTHGAFVSGKKAALYLLDSDKGAADGEPGTP